MVPIHSPPCQPPAQPPRPFAPPPQSVAERINKRFRDGRPSSHLSEVGVLIHQLDGWERPMTPWIPAEAGKLANAGVTMSASLILRRLQERPDRAKDLPLFSAHGGVVLHPDHAYVLCAYVGDGATQAKVCPPSPRSTTDCIPGCSLPAGYCDVGEMFDPNNPWCLCGLDWCQGGPRPFAPHDLETAVERFLSCGNLYDPARGFNGVGSGYNEIVLDAQHWAAHLPAVIEAFFFVSDGGAAKESAARQAHSNFIRTYQLDPNAVPLLELRAAPADCGCHWTETARSRRGA